MSNEFSTDRLWVQVLSIEWINLISLNVSAIAFAYLATLSVMPVTREEKRGIKAWDECAKLRSISFCFAGIMIINVILWFWYPIPELNWLLNTNPFLGISIGLIIGIPCFIIMMIAVKDAGKEMNAPQKETKMHG